MDGLTGEQMGAYLERVFHQHNDWMIYTITLLERAWLVSEQVHGCERAIFQILSINRSAYKSTNSYFMRCCDTCISGECAAFKNDNDDRRMCQFIMMYPQMSERANM
eukprot:12206325-Ditylum_brightwellii.AAC.1